MEVGAEIQNRKFEVIETSMKLAATLGVAILGVRTMINKNKK